MRTHGTGTLMPRGGKYVARLDRQGKQVQRTFTKKADAEKWLRDTITEVERAGTMRPAKVSATVTVGAVLDDFVTRDVERIERSATRVAKLAAVERVRKVLGTKRASAVRVLDVEEAFTQMAASYSQSSVRASRQALGQAWDAALRRELITTPSPLALARTPKGKPPTGKRALSIEQRNALLDGTADHPLGAAIAVGALAGLRPGEVLALKWDAIDLKRGTLHVHRGIQLDGARPYVSDDVKNSRSERVLSMTPRLIAILRAHKAAQRARRIAATSWADDGLVFTNDAGGVLYVAHFSDVVWAATKRLSLPAIKAHELRHTFATIAAEAGVPFALLSRYLGQSITATTERYFNPTEQVVRLHSTNIADPDLAALFGEVAG